MDEDTNRKVIELLDQHRIMTVATNRPDGWPQATTVGYANDGPTLYFLCSPNSQKAENLAKDNRLSLTVDHDTANPMAITSLSMAALAYPADDPKEAAKAIELLGARYPEYAIFPIPKTARNSDLSRRAKDHFHLGLFQRIWAYRSGNPLKRRRKNLGEAQCRH
jgi:nitroimidazol reductase NimA-like FMN-containing flavoprotein (pyridoxamine 5'-phosphate oxidase superfamily)